MLQATLINLPKVGTYTYGDLILCFGGLRVRNHYRYISFGRFTPRSPQTGTVYHQLVTESGNSEYIAF